MKLNLFLTLSVSLSLLSNVVKAEADVVHVIGDACEKFSDTQSKSTIRVRVTDKASYKAVSRIEDLAGIRSNMLEHDFNVIVYNLVDNYVQNLMVRTISQNDDELCVEVTGEIPSRDIVNVIANYSSSSPAPEYDIKEANNIKEVALDEIMEEVSEETAEPSADILYKASPEEIAAMEFSDEIPMVEEEKGLVFVAPVQFYNETYSQKSSEPLIEMFNESEILKSVESNENAQYSLYSKVLKAKIDPINSQTKRLQMVVSVELKTKGSDISVTEHQNRFVLFEEGETEQEVAQNLLKKLLQKAGEKLYKRIDQMERKRQNISLPPIITPSIVN